MTGVTADGQRRRERHQGLPNPAEQSDDPAYQARIPGSQSGLILQRIRSASRASRPCEAERHSKIPGQHPWHQALQSRATLQRTRPAPRASRPGEAERHSSVSGPHHGLPVPAARSDTPAYQARTQGSRAQRSKVAIEQSRNQRTLVTQDVSTPGTQAVSTRSSVPDQSHRPGTQAVGATIIRIPGAQAGSTRIVSSPSKRRDNPVYQARSGQHPGLPGPAERSSAVGSGRD